MTASGTYYIKGTTPGGCSVIGALSVTVYPPPVISINTAIATFPETVDLQTVVDQSTTSTLTYWRDAATTQPLSDFNALNTSGTYYVKAVSPTGCSSVTPVGVTINPPADPIIAVSNTFTPNNDGVNDLFKVKIDGVAKLRNFRIFNRYGQLMYISTSLSEPWDGRNNGQPVPTGTYYWIFEGVNEFSGAKIVQSGSVAVLR